jgi:hypothetical protein
MTRLLDGSDPPSVGGWGLRAARNAAIHLIPAAAVGALMVGLIAGLAGAVLGFVALYVAPGWLLWKILRGPVSSDPVALPAVWLVFSFLVLIPAVGPVVFFGGPARPVEWYALIVLVVLGIAASRVPSPRLERPGWMGIAGGAAAVSAMVFRAFTWHTNSDDLTFLGYMRATYLGEYPSVNPFLLGDLPLNLRWRFSGWTGISGVLSHVADADPEVILRTVLVVALIPFVASALYLLVRVLSGDRSFAMTAGLAALIVPLVIGTQGKGDHKFLYRDLPYDKFSAILIFVPVIAALLVMFYRSPRRSFGILVSAVVWASLFTHAVTILMGIGFFFVFVLLDRFVTRPAEWRSAASWSLIVVAPLILTAGLASLGGERHGTLASDVAELSDIAAPTMQLGPLQLWEPLPLGAGEVANADPEDAAALFSRGFATQASPIVMFLPNGWPLPHPQTLTSLRYLIVALAALIILIGRHRDAVAVWILASIGTTALIYLFPPAAVLAARFITPWQLYRFTWLLPVPLIVAWLVAVWLRGQRWAAARGVALGLVLALVVGSTSYRALLRTSPSRSDERLTATVEQLEGYSGVLIGELGIMYAAVTRWPDLLAVSHRGFSSMSNAFPVTRQDEAVERFVDVRRFYRGVTTDEQLAILDRYGIRYIIIHRDDRALFDREALGLGRVAAIGNGNFLYEWQPGEVQP